MTSRLTLMVATVGGLLATAGVGFAQPSAPLPPAFPPAFPTSSTAGMTAALGSASVSPAACAGCAPAAVPHYSAHNSLGHHGGGLGLLGHRGIGAGCASDAGCSSYAQERTFFWGGCRQFFNPGNDCGHPSLFGGGLFGKHDYYLPGPGGLTNPNPCVYGSYLNR